MKKVLVLAAIALMFAAPAIAAVTGTAHDLSSGTTSSNTDEICVFCHTPHGASAAGFAPLWNRTSVNATVVYGNPAGTMDAVPTLASVNASDAVLCLSCHDGASVAGNLTNPPNALGGAQPTVTATVSANATLGTDLSNDHPVGFVYDAALVAADGELQAVTTQALYGAGSDTMWCSSCHDVHDNTNSPFLISTNAGSALCLTCHIK